MISAIFEGALVLPGKYYGHLVTRGANNWIRGKIELSSYVNKASLNPVFGNFQRSLSTLRYHIYIFVQHCYQDTGKKDRCAVYGCDNDRRYPAR